MRFMLKYVYKIGLFNEPMCLNGRYNLRIVYKQHLYETSYIITPRAERMELGKQVYRMDRRRSFGKGER